MVNDLLSQEDFLARLTDCFADPDDKSSVWLTHKRYDASSFPGGDGDIEIVEEEPEAEGSGSGVEYPVLIRCVHGSKAKFSARIPASSLASFHASYGALIKASVAPSMRKRDKKREKARAEAQAKKRREVYVDTPVGTEGKRGKGRRQRVRKIVAQKKKEAEREKIEEREEKRRVEEGRSGKAEASAA